MKRLLAIAALLVAPLGCVANQGAAFVRFLNARDYAVGSTTCDTVTDRYIPAGALDVSGPYNYLLSMSIETNTQVQPITINQVGYQGNGLSDITLYEVVYSYEFSDSSAGISLPKEETVPIYVVFRPQADPTSNYVGLYGIGPQALAALQTYYRANPGKSATLITHIKAKAYLSGSEETETNIFRFPITIFSSGFVSGPGGGCPTGTMSGGGSRCGLLGQDQPICHT